MLCCGIPIKSGERDMLKILWHELTREEQDLYLTLLWHDGHSEQAIADFLGITKGPIVRRRQSNLKLLTTRGRSKVKRSVNPERFADLLDLYAMAELEARGVTPIAPAGRCQWPLSEHKKTYELVSCNKPVVPGHHLCEEHLSLIRRRRPQ